MAADLEVIWVRRQVKNSEKQKYFCRQGWTGQITLIGFDKSGFWKNGRDSRKTPVSALRRYDGSARPTLHAVRRAVIKPVVNKFIQSKPLRRSPEIRHGV
jgi:hypothetical protein